MAAISIIFSSHGRNRIYSYFSKGWNGMAFVFQPENLYQQFRHVINTHLHFHQILFFLTLILKLFSIHLLHHSHTTLFFLRTRIINCFHCNAVSVQHITLPLQSMGFVLFLNSQFQLCSMEELLNSSLAVFYLSSKVTWDLHTAF